MSDNRVKPCPFCGGWPTLTHWTTPRTRVRWSLGCDACAFIMERPVKRDLFRTWNLRANHSDRGKPYLRRKP